MRRRAISRPASTTPACAGCATTLAKLAGEARRDRCVDDLRRRARAARARVPTLASTDGRRHRRRAHTDRDVGRARRSRYAAARRRTTDVSFILDALRKSEHERQRSAVPGLSQVPLATPQPQLPRWAFAVIGVLVAAVLALGGAWWQSTRAPADGAARIRPSSAASSCRRHRCEAPCRNRRRRRGRCRRTAAGAVARARGCVRARTRRRHGAPALDAAAGSTRRAAAPALPSPAALAAEGVALAHAAARAARLQRAAARAVRVHQRPQVRRRRAARRRPAARVDRADGRGARARRDGGSCSFRSERGSAVGRFGDGRDQASRRRCADR